MGLSLSEFQALHFQTMSIKCQAIAPPGPNTITSTAASQQTYVVLHQDVEENKYRSCSGSMLLRSYAMFSGCSVCVCVHVSECTCVCA